MSGMSATAGERGIVVSGLRGLPGWAVEFPHGSNAVVLRPPEGETVTATTWRKIPIGACLAVAQSERDFDVPRALAMLIAADGVEPEQSSRSGPESHLRRVAAVYRIALENDLWPPELLADVFGAKIPTTHRWIANAQQRGYLRSHAEESAAYSHPGVTVAAPEPAAIEQRFGALLRGADRSGRSPGRGSSAMRKTSTKEG